MEIRKPCRGRSVSGDLCRKAEAPTEPADENAGAPCSELRCKRRRVRASSGHLCEAEAPTEAAAETRRATLYAFGVHPKAPDKSRFFNKKTADRNQRSDFLWAPFCNEPALCEIPYGRDGIGRPKAAFEKKGRRKKRIQVEQLLLFRGLPACGEDVVCLLTMLIILKKIHLSSHFTQII